MNNVKKVAILTAGGLAPCLSSAIAALIERYTDVAPEVEIICYVGGYKGLLEGKSITVTPEMRKNIAVLYKHGGSPIGNSRVKLTNIKDCVKRGLVKEGQDPQKVAADQLVKDGVDVLHTIGGDDTNTAAADLAAESFEEEVENDAATNGTSIKDSRKKLLEEKGYESVEEMKSDIIYERKGSGVGRLISEENVNTMNSMLRSVIEGGTGANANIAGEMVFGKTGTSQNNRDAWFIGYTPDLVTGVFMGKDDNTSIGLTGGSAPARIWKDMMIVATEKYGAPEFGYPPVDFTIDFEEDVHSTNFFDIFSFYTI